MIPFFPPPYWGTNDPDLVYSLYHITTWLDKVQRWHMSLYHDLIHHYAVTCGPKEDRQVQKTQWHKMPSSYDLFCDL